MKRMLLLLALGGAVVMAAMPAQAANGTLSLGWDDACSPVVNKDWDGSLPFTANLIVGVTGSDVVNDGFTVMVELGPNVKDAWRFESGACQLENWVVSSTGTKACPPFKGAFSLAIPSYTFDSGTNRALINISLTYDSFSPLAGTSYTLWKASFDHAFSILGAGDPAVDCEFAGDALCFAIKANHKILLPDGSEPPFDAVAQGWATWQDAANAVSCPSVQAQTSTWGQIKNLYR